MLTQANVNRLDGVGSSGVEYCFEALNWSPIVGFDQPDLHRIIDAASHAGFAWIAFDVPSLDLHVARGGSLSDLRQRMDANGLRALTLHAVGIDGDIIRTEATGRHASQYCEALGIAYLNASLRVPLDEAAISGIKRMRELASMAGSSFAMEYFAHSHVNSLEKLIRILDAADVRGRSIILDAWQFFASGDSWQALEDLPVDDIAYVQFSDHKTPIEGAFFEETVQHRLFPGEGDFELNRFARTLQGKAYRGIVGVEVLSATSRSLAIETFAQRAIGAAKAIWESG